MAIEDRIEAGQFKGCETCAYCVVDHRGGKGPEWFCHRYPQRVKTPDPAWCGEYMVYGTRSNFITDADYFHATGKEPEAAE